MADINFKEDQAKMWISDVNNEIDMVKEVFRLLNIHTSFMRLRRSGLLRLRIQACS